MDVGVILVVPISRSSSALAKALPCCLEPATTLPSAIVKPHFGHACDRRTVSTRFRRNLRALRHLQCPGLSCEHSEAISGRLTRHIEIASSLHPRNWTGSPRDTHEKLRATASAIRSGVRKLLKLSQDALERDGGGGGGVCGCRHALTGSFRKAKATPPLFFFFWGFFFPGGERRARSTAMPCSRGVALSTKTRRRCARTIFED